MNIARHIAFAILATTLISACDSDDDDDSPTDNTPIGLVEFEINFADESEGWSAGFADYPAGEEEFYELSSGIEVLPSPLDDRSGFNLSGSNRSDDLFMYLARQFGGLEPGRRYMLDFEVSIASNVPSGCAGIGGAPGESVTLKAGASITQPMGIPDGNGDLRMNIDIGSQSAGGTDAIPIGNIANSQDCEQPESVWEIVMHNNTDTSFTAFTDDEGALWILFGTDSGFEGITSIYFTQAIITATPL